MDWKPALDAFCTKWLSAAPPAPAAQGVDAPLIEWAVERWKAEVENRPLINVHRRSLDDTWRQVIRHAGGDPDLVLPLQAHDELVMLHRSLFTEAHDKPTLKHLSPKKVRELWSTAVQSMLKCGGDIPLEFARLLTEELMNGGE